MKPHQKSGGPQVTQTQQPTTTVPMQQLSVQDPYSNSALSFINIQPANAQSEVHHSSDNGSGSKQLHTHSVQFSAGQAIIWQIKFIINCYLHKKTIAQLSEKFGTDFDKYLFRELIEQIDLNDPNKAAKDKNEAIKSQLLNQELTRASSTPSFLSYFGEIAETIFGGRYADFHAEMVKRLKLAPKMALLIALSMASSCNAAGQAQCNNLLKLKMIDYLALGPKTTEVLEEYAVHRFSYLQATDPDFSEQQLAANPKLKDAFRMILADSPIKPSQSVALRIKASFGDLINQNPSADEPSNAILRNGSGLEHLQFANKILEPWEVLLDLGHFVSFNYQQLIMALQDFKDINERAMANMILHLSLNNTGQDNSQSRIVLNTFEANKLGDPQVLKKEPSDKNTTMQWQVSNFARAFREIYSNLSYYKVFESFNDLGEGLDPEVNLDAKAYSTLLQLFNKSKPQNLQLPVSLLLDGVWKSPSLQLSFIKNAIRCYTSNEDKTFSFAQSTRKIAAIDGLTHTPSSELIDVWSQPEVIESLLRLSTRVSYGRIREVFDTPIKQVPEYLLLTISKCNISQGCILVDELLSILMPMFLAPNQNSMPVLKKLWEFNTQLMIRGICELCTPEHKTLNLSRVLDITQEIKDSLVKIVYCSDYDFAVRICTMAAHKEYFHYDVWLKERIKGVGAPFVKALVKYINEELIIPCKVELIKQGIHVNKQLSQAQLDALEDFKDQQLERSFMTKERLCLTIEHLENPANFQSLIAPPTFVPGGAQTASNVQGQLTVSEKIIAQDAQNQIKDLVCQYAILFPRQVSPTQSTDEIDKAANEYFQHIFSAPPDQVEPRIQQLIVTMQNFKKSQVVKEQEIYACMLHCLFDEYRFLHRYPQQYLEKIAKLFGAIMKNKLLDNILQDIALKFVIEAFRREGKRQSFGIIVIKEIFECLPDFPKQFQDIYSIRDKVQRQDAQLYEDIGKLYNQTLGNKDYNEHKEKKQEQPVSSQTETFPSKPFVDIQLTMPAQAEQPEDSKNKKAQNQYQKNKFPGPFEEIASTSSPFQPTFTPVQPQTSVFPQPQPQTKNQARNKNQAQAKAQEQIKAGPTQQAEPKQSTPVFVPSQSVKNMTNQQLAQQNPISNMNVNSASFTQIGQIAPLPRSISTNDPIPNILEQVKTTQRAAATSQDHFKTDDASLRSLLAKAADPNTKAFRPWEFEPAPASVRGNQSLNASLNSGLNNALNTGLNASMNTLVAPFFVSNQPDFTPSQYNQELTQWMTIQSAIDQKINDAKNNKMKVRFEDMIEDNLSELPTQDDQETIKFICNNTGKNNFEPKLEDLKQVVRQNEVNLKWFIHYILTKRISMQYQKQQHIYIDLVRQLGIPDTVSRTVRQAVEIFKKCMLIDEPELQKVVHKPVEHPQRSMLKQYLQALGSFLGAITLAFNTPIKRQDLDLKQLLLQGYFHEQRRNIVVFVCKILREAHRSTVFKIQNPWMNSIMQVIYEIHVLTTQPHIANQDNDIIMEIESLLKLFGITGLRDICTANPNHLQALQRQQSNNVTQQVELSYLNTRSRLPIRQKTSLKSTDGSQPSGGAYSKEISQLHSQPDFNQTQQETVVAPQAQHFMSNIQMAPEAMKVLSTKFNLTQEQIKSILYDSVDASIVDILGPVVDRSVTIALITTKQLVLKDFAFDGNVNRVREAADQIVQNLAGSLALVTCREPLRISLQNNLLKLIKRTCSAQYDQELRASGQVNPQELEARVEMYIADHDDEFQEVAQTASKENLDLGCKMIKRAVIDKALRKVREDVVMNAAIEKRDRAAQSGITNFVDEEIAKTMVELPPQLQPNRNGLDTAQFKVYSDFSKLNYRSRLDQPMQSFNSQPEIGQKQTSPLSYSTQKKQEPAVYDFDLEKILQKIDKEGQLTSVTRGLLTLKLNQINKEAEQPNSNMKATFQRISDYAEDKLQKACFLFETSPTEAQDKMEILSLIVRKSLKQNLSMELLDKTFMEMEECYLLNPELTVQLMKYQIINVGAWDRKFYFFVRESPGSLHEQAVDFLAKFIQIAVITQRFIKPEMVQNVIKLLEEFQNYKVSYLQNPSVRGTIQTISQEVGKLQLQSKEYQLRTLFQKWVELLSIDDSAAQEKEMNNYFSDLGALGIDQDREMLYTFTQVMVKHSIEFALYTKEGRRRQSNNTLDYRFIDSFIKLVIVLLKTFDFDKREFMLKIFNFIKAKLIADHDSQQGSFNQKPFYRTMMNMLTAVNISNLFSPKVQKQILFDIADVLTDVNPNNCPAFAFAWLELISHKQFMPHFIKRVQGEEPESAEELEKQAKIKGLLLLSFSFLKNNMAPGQKVQPSLQRFYTAVTRIVLVILIDSPQFLCDYHFDFVNALPDHAIQLKNMILAAFPKTISPPYPLSKDLKVDTLQDVRDPKILSNFESCLKANGIADDLMKFFATKSFDLVPQICNKMMASKENINGRVIPNSSVINAVILFIVTQVCNQKKQGAPETATNNNVELLKQMATYLNDETRLCFLNSIVNELRYPNSHTFYFCMILIILFCEQHAVMKEQISTILFERLQAHRPFPWGLMINFRELIQNTKYGFMRSDYIAANQQAINHLFKHRLRLFIPFIQPQQLQQQRHNIMGSVSD